MTQGTGPLDVALDVIKNSTAKAALSTPTNGLKTVAIGTTASMGQKETG